jgi:hypothetical protein
MQLEEVFQFFKAMLPLMMCKESRYWYRYLASLMQYSKIFGEHPSGTGN